MTCFTWISSFKQISWMNDFVTHSKIQPNLSFLNESIVWNKSIEWMIKWLIHKHSHVFLPEWIYFLYKSVKQIIQWFIHIDLFPYWSKQNDVSQIMMLSWQKYIKVQKHNNTSNGHVYQYQISSARHTDNKAPKMLFGIDNVPVSS